MAALRSSLPSRLRQLLSGETAVGPSIRLDSEPPPKVKAFIDKVIQSPLQDIAIPLSGFRWEYDKGNFHHWRPLFLHFEEYLKTYVSSRNDLILSDKLTEDDSPFPKHAVLQILRVMQIILENCHNKSSFNGLEYFKLLLSSTDPEVLIASLETLSALVRIDKLHGGGKSIGCGAVNRYLLSLAQGWGSKEEGLGLHSCVVANEKTQDEGLSLFPSELDKEGDNSQFRLGSTLYFELKGVSGQNEEPSVEASRVIHMPDLHLRKEDDLFIMKQCIEQYNVPPDLRFPLLTRIRYAHAFRSARTCRLYSRISLLAFIVLVQSNDAHEELTAFFANEPEYTNELIRIVQSEDSIPGSIRTLAMLALGAQLAAYISSHDRARILSGSSLSFTATNRTILLNVLQKAVVSLNNSSDPSSLAFVEALLQFYVLHIVSSSTSGNNLRGWGMLPTFLPLLEDSHPGHMHLVCFAVKTIQKLMDYSSSAVSHFRELGGVELLVQRLQLEVHRVIGFAGEIDVSHVGECSRSNEDLLSSQRRLIKVCLKALSATYSAANPRRPQNTQETVLSSTLSDVFQNVEKFGGDVYHSAVTLMSEIIHNDPTCLPALFEMGLPKAFLASVTAGILPAAKALTCVPNGLGAICLNTRGVDAVKETSALRFLVNIFISKKYVLPMNEAIVPLANAVEELLRHVLSLRSDGIDIIVEIVDKISSFGETNRSGSSGTVDGSTSMDMDSEDEENASGCSVVGSVDSTVDHVSDEQFIQLLVFHVMVLVHRTMENSEACRLFVEKSGIDALLKLLLRPSIAQSSEGMSIALHSTMVFKGFTQHHSAPLAHAFCSALREHLKKALAGFLSCPGSFLLDPKGVHDEEIFSEISLVEFLLFLAASKENRWVTALLQEFANGSKDVLEDIGRLHREVIWQIALLEDAKTEKEYDVHGSHQSEFSSNETEEQTFNSFRELFDPMMRRRTSTVDMQNQFLEFFQLYRSLSGGSNFRSDVPSSLRRGSSHEENPSHSADSTSRKELDEQRSFYESCCDMVRSLSFHITHLFQELGKVMLVPSRRREDTMSVSPSSKAVASAFASIALDHMNFGGHVDSSGSQASVSTKCRFFGKVIEFIDGILMDRQDSFNPILLNCLYGRGIIQSVLTTFEATSQLLFAVNESPTSPMITDSKQDEKEDAGKLWIYGPLASYGKLMDHLVTSSFILTPFTKHLLIQPLANSDIPFPRDAETFVKVLQSSVLKSVLPVWSHPQFIYCSCDFIATVISVVKHVFSGVEVKNVSGNVSSRISGPPPNEATISTIVEMGFSRSRAEEALRHVGSNSVEIAMEWLLSHPEEAQEDDELARALAMSLGNSESDSGEDGSNAHGQHVEAELVQLPVVEELLSTCVKLLQVKESLAFPVHDLLMTICSHKDGQCRYSVISFIIGQLRDCSLASDGRHSTLLPALFHVLALVLHEDVTAREIASKSGLVELASDLLSRWDSISGDRDNYEVPKWVTAAFLALDRLLQADHKLNAEMLEQLKRDEGSSVDIHEDTKSMLQSALGLSLKHIDVQQQKKLIQIACNSIRNQLPSETVHAVLQLCATLTRNHSVAISFLDAGGLSLLLSLPTDRLFPGFDSVAATIICHVLEDPYTLQQAMESEIKHSLVVAANRHPNGRVSPRNFLSSLTNVISRDPIIFMQAAKAVCQVEMVGERPYVVLLKDREKDKTKEKEDKASERERLASDGKVSLGGYGNGQGRSTDSNSKNARAHRKFPQSFYTVIELLLDSVIAFEPPFSNEISQSTSLTSDMDIDVAAVKGKGKAIACVSESETSNAEASASLAKVVFILKLLTEILMMYASSVHVLLRKDADGSSCRGTHQKGCSGGMFHHVLHKFVPCAKSSRKERKTDGDWRHKLSSRASQFLVASCVRSAEARRRVFSEIQYVLNDYVSSCKGYRPPGSELQVYVDLLNDVLTARSPTGSYLSAEASATFIDIGLVRSLTDILKVLDLDHVDSPKVASAIVKALELVSKEYVHSVDSNLGKSENAVRPADHSQPEGTANGAAMAEPMEASSQSNHEATATENAESFNNLQSYGGSEAVTDDMEHDQVVLDGASSPGSEDDFMHETSEDNRELQNGIGTVQYDIQPHAQENIDDDDEDEEMSDDDDGDDDEDDDEDDDHNDLEEEEVHHLAHHDMDQDDNDIDGDDDFDEGVLEEDEDDEDGVILRLEEGINGINVFDHIEVLGRNHTFPSDTFHLMPLEVFGSRRLPRTTSIYNLLGRTGSTAPPSRHPLLTRPTSLFSSSHRQLENSSDMLSTERNNENPSTRLDVIFRSLRSGRHGHRLNLWVDENQQMSGSSAATIPPGLEDVLISQLRRPPAEKPSEDKDDEPKSNGELTRMQQSESGVMPEAEGHVSGEGGDVAPSVATDGPGHGDMGTPVRESVGVNHPSAAQAQSVDVQLEQNDAIVQDVEAVSQESGGSGATLGESLRSLDVEIGSADGQDDGGERQGSADRVTLSDPHAARSRRTNVSFGTAVTATGRETSLQRVTEVPEDSTREGEQDAPTPEQQINPDAGSGSIDPAFLDALPEELRAEVLSVQQGQVGQTENAEPQGTGDIDPEFLAALPPDIQAEVLAQQQAQRLQQSQELEGQPVEMDTVSIIATFPSDLREEVLLTSSDSILANLTPALVAEANMLRERFAHRYHNQTLFGMYPRNRRGESSRRGVNSGSSLDRAAGGLGSRRLFGMKLVEADGAPLVDSEALKSMIRLFHVVQPLYKGQLQRLLLNLCAHCETRTALVNIFMDMLILGTRKPFNHLTVAESASRLYVCQNNVMYSHPHSFDGVPPLVSRRVLETMTYLARNHHYVAKILLHLRLPYALPVESEKTDHSRGKAIMIIEESEKQPLGQYSPTELLLSLLNQPLYLRSIAHLEQLLGLLEVVIDHAENKESSPGKSEASAAEPSGSQVSLSDAAVNAESGSLSSEAGTSVANVDNDINNSTEKDVADARTVLLKLPHRELRLLCSLLAKEGLSDNAYVLVAEVIKKLVKAAPTHCHLFIAELASVVQSLTRSAMDELKMYGETIKALLSVTSSEGSAILRVLRALSSLVSTLKEKESDQKVVDVLHGKKYSAALSQVWDINAALEPLWLELSNCISKIESYSDSSSELSLRTSKSIPSGIMTPLPAGSQNVLPYIESFFIVAEKLHPAQTGSGNDFGIAAVPELEDATASASRQKAPSSSSSAKVDERQVAFVKFSERHKKLLNAFIRQNPGLLEKSFSLLLKVPRFIEFDNKRAHFRSKVKHGHDNHHSLRISVRRAYILEDSYNQLRMRSAEDLKGRLTVHFQGEEAVDAGGPKREWYQVLSRVIFDKGALLFTTVGNESTFQPNPNSVYQTEHLSYFKFVGRVVGKALFDGQLLDVHFTRSFYKHILGVKVTYLDIEAIDPDYFKNLKWMLENDITDVLDLTFSIDADEEKLILCERNEVTDHELLPGGRNVKVTEENKHQYVDLLAEHRLTTAIRPQITAFLEGFNELILPELISIFNDKELELLISGLPEIDLDDMRANTEYSGYSAGSPVIQWFWEVVQGFSKEDRARLLQFVTGTSKVPLEGFSALQGISGSQKFQIHKAYGSPDHLPSAHTCFNQLDLPEYPSKQHLEERLLLAIHEASEGFGFG